MTVSDNNVAGNAGGGGLESSVASPTRCMARIVDVQRRWLALNRFLGVGLLMAAVSVSGAIAVVIDGWLRGGHLARSLLLAVGIIAVAWLGRRFVVPLWRRLSYDQAALMLERAYPELDGRLVTAVQLTAPTVRERSGTSLGLYQQVCTAAERTAAGLDVSRVLPGRSPFRRSAIAWGIVLVLLVVAGLNRESASIGAARLLMPWRQINWPQLTQIEIISVDERVVRGGTLTLTGAASGDIPATGTLNVRSETGVADRARFEIAAGGEFTVQYRPVNSDLTISVEIGDARSRVIEVQMVPPPEIVALEAECTYPAYTRLAPQRLDDGNVQAVYGSQVRLRVSTNKPVASATLAWVDESETVPMRVTAEKEAEARLRVEASRSYRIHLTDDLGFGNEEPVVYRIEMVDNLYPRIDRATPMTDRFVTPQAVLPITAEVSDDFGVTEVTLCYHRGKAEGEPQRVAIPLERAGKQVAVEHQWPLEPLAVEAGETITYWLEARDAGEHAERSDWPTSPTRSLLVMDEPELARQLSDKLEEILDGLAELEALQGECTDAVVRIDRSVEALAPGAAAAPALRQRARTEKWRQDHLARMAGQWAVRLGRVAEDYVISRIGQPERAQRLERTADQLARISGTAMPGIVLSLEEALVGLRQLAVADTQPREEP